MTPKIEQHSLPISGKRKKKLLFEPEKKGKGKTKNFQKLLK